MLFDLSQKESHSIINNRGAKEFIKLYAKHDNWHNLDISSANLGYGLILYSIIRTSLPKKILCIGSRYGFIPAICALACKDNRFGQVDFVDANYDQNNLLHTDNWGGVGYWTTKQGKRAFHQFRLNKYISLHLMTTKLFHEQHPRESWQYIHIDGDHSYKGVKNDFRYFWPRLTKNGIMGLHDIYSKDIGRTDYGVYKLWIELKKQYGYTMIEFPGKFGLGLIQKTQ